jgi:hypothetical protein
LGKAGDAWVNADGRDEPSNVKVAETAWLAVGDYAQ